MSRVVYITLVLALASHGLMAQTVRFACRMSGEIMSACCCPDAGTAESDAEIHALQTCCDVTIVRTATTTTPSRPTAPTADDLTHPPIGPMAALLATGTEPELDPSFRPVPAMADASPPPLILLTQSFRC